jgi:hypothetical protein
VDGGYPRAADLGGNPTRTTVEQGDWWRGVLIARCNLGFVAQAGGGDAARGRVDLICGR